MTAALRSGVGGGTVAQVAAPAALPADHAVARILAVTDDEGSLYPRVLAAVGDALEWDFGALWVAGLEPDSLVCVKVWSADDFDPGPFAGATRTLRFPLGVGLPGRVWESGEPAWLMDLPNAPNFPRSSVAKAVGLEAAFGFPISTPGGPIGVMEFFTRESRTPDAELLATMASLGSQIGQFVVRRRAEREVLEGAERKRAILDAALDCVITVDAHGAVLEFNAAAERTFGYPAEDAIGADMADLIVPPSLRPRHQAAFSRYLATETATVLGRRLEMTAMRADGSEFPVELTITRINLPGPPTFTGYIRDTTDLKRAEAEVRASRARIVEAGDAERRRLERDLHDGAQQQLVNLGLTLRLARSRLGEGDGEAAALIDEAIEGLGSATQELREFARGIHPAVLTDGGLGPALATLVERFKAPVELVEVPEERLPAPVEATAYFLVAEALTNYVRYSEAPRAEVRAALSDGDLVVEVRDEGRGGADPAGGSGLSGLADRVSALGGKLEVVSPAGEGTVVRSRIPCR
jgi:PAS domain S-box-containing protein